MARLWVVTAMAALGCLIATVGAALTAGAVVGIAGGWAYSALRYAPDWNVGLLPLVLPLQLVIAGWVVWGVLTLDPRPLLRNLLLAFGGSFLALYGWYFLLGGLGDGGGLVGVGNLLYLLAGLLVVPAALVGGALGPGGVRRERVVQGLRTATGALVAVLFLSTAVVVGYRAMPVPPEAQTLGPPDQPPLSCQGGKEEIAAFDGRGDMVTPAFETTGHIWGYEFASVGYGTLSIEILDENGKVVSDHEQPVPAGTAGGGEYALGSGTFKLDMDADEDLRYAVIVCDETDPRGKNLRTSG